MFKRNAPRKTKSLLVIYLTFFLLFSIPLVIWGTQSGSFDIRNRAFDDLTVSDTNPCVISLPNVNPYTLDVGKSITVQVDAKLSDAAIASLSITDSSGSSIYQEDFNNSPISISTSFKYTPQASGMVDMLGVIGKVGGGSVACKISSTYDVLGLRAMAGNQAPTFTSVPSASKPSQDIKTGINYEYTLTATDEDGDRINYSYSFTPNADWLKATIIEDGSKGKLSIKFSGSTTKAASYLANVFIHDGYSKHLSSQSWVISVSPAENDIPIVRVISPSEKLTINQGDVIKTSWDSSDLNLISSYAIYASQNPTDESSWVLINNNIPAKTTSYSIDTSTWESGTYKIIIKATDNQTPALTGMGISDSIVVNGNNNSNNTDNDDVVVLADPQVINMTPISTDSISNKQVTIKATLISGEKSELNTKSIEFKLDNTDITSDISINKISAQEVTVIYQPTQDLSTGIHKVDLYVKDSNNKSVTKSWTFTITSDNTVQEGYVNIFGLQISQRTLIIIGVGILVVIVAIVAPIIIFSVWKEEQKKNNEDETEGYMIPSIEPSTPIPPAPVTTNIVENVTPPISQGAPNEEKDVWNNYSAPTPQSEENVEAPQPTTQNIEVPEEPEIITPEPEITPVVEAPVITQPEVSLEPITIEEPTTTQQEISTIPSEPIELEAQPVMEEPEPTKEEGIPMPDITQPEIPTTQESTPPEPDLSTDISVDDDLNTILSQIQQTEQNDSDTPKE